MDDLRIQFGELQPDFTEDLPLAFGNETTPLPPTPKPPRRSPLVFDFRAHYSGSLKTDLCQSHQSVSENIAQNHHADVSGSLNVQNCLEIKTLDMEDLQICQIHQYDNSVLLQNCHTAQISETVLLEACDTTEFGDSVLHIADGAANWVGAFQKICQSSEFTGQFLANMISGASQGVDVSGCLKTQTSDSMQPPCYWYNIVLPNKNPEIKSPCGKNPPSDDLPLTFEVYQTETDSLQIPLPFACRTVAQIPVFDSYMILNNISASVNGEPLELFGANIKTDMDSYCWQGSVQIPPQDFEKFDFARQTDLPITLKINGETFVFIGENVSSNREFGRKSFTVSGRSLTAKLGKDYAKNQTGTVNQDLMARQIVDAQLRYTDFKLQDWTAANWRIPSHLFVLTDKTPIAMMQELAQAAGAFVESHPSELILNVKPRWKRAAWLLDDGADMVCPPNVIVKIDEQKQVNTQYNSVLIAPTHILSNMAHVYRDGTDKMPAAPSVSGSLYTAENVCRALGINVLSESGTHIQAQITLAPPSEKYAIGRAKLGEIWRFDEPDGAWWGVITGVELRVAMAGDVAEVWQVLSVDRYLGD